MHTFRFSLLTMFGSVAVVALACAALATPSQLWLVIVSASSLACLFYAVLAATYGRAAKRAFWFGFAVVGWGHIFLEWQRIPLFLPTELAADRLSTLLHDKPMPDYAAWMNTRLGDAPPVGSAVSVGDYVQVWSTAPPPPGQINAEMFEQIVKWLWSPLLGFVGGLVALRLYSNGNASEHMTTTS
jgi:hypothetical protein